MVRSRVHPLPAHTVFALLALLVCLAALLIATPARAGWVEYDAGTPFTLNAVCFTDASSGWAVGYNGGIFVTADGGKTWSPQTSGTTSPLNDVTFRSGIGWAFGGEFAATWILTTTNGGGTWTPQAHNPPAVFTSGDFTDSQHGWAVTTAGWAYRTSDGGTHWTGAATPAEDDWASLNDIDMIDATHGCIVGDYGYVLTTDDAGASWDVAASGVTTNLYDADFASGVGWAVGEAGTILKTTDGGLHWSPQTSGTAETLDGVSCVDAQKAWAVALDGGVLATTNGGSDVGGAGLGHDGAAPRRGLRRRRARLGRRRQWDRARLLGPQAVAEQALPRRRPAREQGDTHRQGLRRQARDELRQVREQEGDEVRVVVGDQGGLQGPVLGAQGQAQGDPDHGFRQEQRQDVPGEVKERGRAEALDGDGEERVVAAVGLEPTTRGL